MILNKEQQEVVKSPIGPILIRAAAGTGKTTVLTERIIYLIQELKINPDGILAITYTNMAAEEMKTRIRARLTDKNQIPSAIGTIHSIFGDLLRKHIELVCSYRKYNFEIIQEDGHWALRESIKKIKGKYTHKSGMKEIKSILSQWKIDKFLNIDSIDANKLEKWEAVFEEYENILKNKNLLDFDDVLILTTKLLQSHEDIRKFWSNKYSAILIDEVQDINEIQWRLIKNLITTQNHNFLAVGDPNQCIYLFNGAKENIFDEISSMFPKLMSFELIQNYRSSPEIVYFCNENKLIDCCQAVSNKTVAGEIKKYSNIEEAFKELRTIQTYSDWAILFPKHADCKKITQLLISHAIPLKSSRFYLLDEPCVKKIIHLLQATFFDTSELLRNVIYIEEFKISSGAKKEILDNKNWEPGESLTDFLLHGEAWKNLCLNSIDIEQLDYCIQTLKIFRNQSENDLVSLTKYIHQTLFKNSELKDTEVEQINLFIKWLDNIQAQFSSLTSLEIVLNIFEHSVFSKENIMKKTNNAVTLSTIHKSKGLEWKKVIVLEWDRLQKESEVQTKDKHLAYVAISRAQEKLILVS